MGFKVRLFFLSSALIVALAYYTRPVYPDTANKPALKTVFGMITQTLFLIVSTCTVKPVLSGNSKRFFNTCTDYRLMQVKKYCRMLQWEYSAILSTFIKLPFSIDIRPLFCLFLSGRLRLGLLYKRIVASQGY